ncbi:MAG: dihydrodipicolinate synthase family protein [Cyclobacteriaceae bacterium]
MSNNALYNLHGIIPPLITPLTRQLTLDTDALSQLLKHVIEGGVHGIFVLGTTGEAPSLPETVKMALLQQVSEEVGQRIPWLAGITDCCLADAVDWAQRAERLGATAVVAAPPFYYPASQTALYDFFRQLSEESPLPLFLYNIPSHTRNILEPDTVVALLKLPNIEGYKDSTVDLMHFHRLQQQCADIHKSYFVGPEEFLLETVLLGAQGGVNGGANIFPSLYVRLYEAVQQHDLDKARFLHQQIMQISHHLYQDGKTVISGIKFALAERGIGTGLLVPPLTNLSEAEKEKMRTFLQEFNEHL